MSSDSLLSKFDFLRSLPNLIIFSLFVLGTAVLVWVGSLTINDITVWNKDLGTIFFGSRTGENISLGIGMTLINYSGIHLDFIVDDNPFKQGKFAPKSNIPIVSINELNSLSETESVLFVPLAWNFFKEIKQKIKSVRNCSHDKFLTYFPKVDLE